MPLEFYLIIFAFSLVASIFGIMFGGGSFITLPILFLLGIDPKIAVATSVVANLFLNATGSTVFLKAKAAKIKVVKWLAPAFLIGAIIGVFVLVNVDATLIKKLVSVAILFFAILSFFRNHENTRFRDLSIMRKEISFLAMLLVGIYSVVIVAGYSILIIFILVYLDKMYFKQALETRPLIPLLGALVSGLILIYFQLIDFQLLIPLTLGFIAGGYIGSEIILHTDGRIIRILFSVVAIGLALLILFF